MSSYPLFFILLAVGFFLEAFSTSLHIAKASQGFAPFQASSLFFGGCPQIFVCFSMDADSTAA